MKIRFLFKTEIHCILYVKASTIADISLTSGFLTQHDGTSEKKILWKFAESKNGATRKSKM